MQPTRKTYPVTCACEKQHVFDVTVDVDAQPQAPAGKQPPAQAFAVQKYCPFCDKMIEVLIPDKPASTDSVTRE